MWLLDYFKQGKRWQEGFEKDLQLRQKAWELHERENEMKQAQLAKADQLQLTYEQVLQREVDLQNRWFEILGRLETLVSRLEQKS